ncbi:neutral zinc metallopeptidase [Planococcus chinensis]|uniref:Neutral zinc metallopeptidase n=1 Tax=Planococcus chinensis TaxID=272917 RepID=A0ABW4QEU2_9BACL
MKNGLRKKIILLLIPLLIISWSGALANGVTSAEHEVPPKQQTTVNTFQPTITWGDSLKTMEEFLHYVANDVEAFWVNVIDKKNLISPVPTLDFFFPKPGESMGVIGCGALTQTNDETAQYCPWLGRVYISQALAYNYWHGIYRRNNDPSPYYSTGHFSAALLVAHEAGHAMESYLGNPITLLRSKELYADCLSGVWANSLYQRGYLQNTDLEQANRTLHDIGDYSQLPTEHRGTPAQRHAAFLSGYNQGTMESCQSYANGYVGN